jgi:hypothetical protein
MLAALDDVDLVRSRRSIAGDDDHAADHRVSEERVHERGSARIAPHRRDEITHLQLRVKLDGFRVLSMYGPRRRTSMVVLARALLMTSVAVASCSGRHAQMDMETFLGSETIEILRHPSRVESFRISRPSVDAAAVTTPGLDKDAAFGA